MKVIIFDMYGVIMKAPEGDLIPFLHSIFPDVPDEQINALWKEAAYGKLSSIDFFRQIGFQKDIDEIEIKYLDTIEIDEDFLDLATTLKENYRLVLLSNDISEWNLYLRNKYSLNEIFDLVIVSGDQGVLKPNAGLFNVILDQLGVMPSECVFIDDREKNLLAAEKLGMKTILFNRRKVEYQGIIVDDYHELRSVLSY